MCLLIMSIPRIDTASCVRLLNVQHLYLIGGLVVGFISLCWCPQGVMAQTQSTGRGQATAQVVAPLYISHATPLNFGLVHAKKQAGSVTITTDNQRMILGDVQVVPQSLFSRAEVAITGTPNAVYSIHLLDSTAQHPSHTGQPGKTLLQIVDLTSRSQTVGSDSSMGRIGPDGTDVLFVGGTLLVPGTAKHGKYEGNVNLTVSY